MNDDIRRLVNSCVVRERVVLSSGKLSNLYADLRLVTLSTSASLRIAEILLDLIEQIGITALGGPIIGACPIISATGTLAAQRGINIKLFYVRTKPKSHGMRRVIEGNTPNSFDTIMLVDDVISTGRSLIKASDRVEEITGNKPKHVFVLLDREEGGADEIRNKGISVHTCVLRRELDI